VIPLSPGVRIYLAPGATDMRKSFTGLSAVVERLLQRDPLSGHLFAFCNRRRNLLKVLFWDGTGLWVLAKRLEKGTFAWPAPPKKGPLTLSSEELVALLGGLDVSQAPRRDWWRRDPTFATAPRAPVLPS